MRVDLAVHGGIAGGINLNRPPVVVDGAQLTEPEAQTLSGLVEAVAADGVPAAGTERARDVQTYVVTVHDGPSPTSFTASDATMTPAYASLVHWLRDHATGG